ncbi:MAG: VacJ family lipoprotein [Sphingomonadales bacterium]|nr:VacJ family lipoprotein [Sphingomonadales bacterium]
MPLPAIVPALASAALLATAQAAPPEAAAPPPAPAPESAAPESPAPAPAASPAPAPAAPPRASAADTSGPAMQDIIVVAPPRPTPADPFARTNVQVFKFVRAMDGAITEPAAMAFKRTVPGPLRSGVRNVFDNLDEPIIAANFLLQLHPGKALETLARFAINSTVGWAGLFDVAKRPYINLPRRPNGFADTLGYYGVKPGPYVFLPLVGPSNPRDLFGGAVDLAAAPLRWVGGPFKTLAWQAPTSLFTALETRIEFQQHLLDFRASERGVYISEREWYRRLREARIAAHKAGDHGPPVDDVTSVEASKP